MKIDKDFLPIYEFNKTFDEKVKKEGADLFAFSVERNDGYSECFSIDVLKEGVDDALNFRRCLVKPARHHVEHPVVGRRCHGYISLKLLFRYLQCHSSPFLFVDTIFDDLFWSSVVSSIIGTSTVRLSSHPLKRSTRW